MRELLRFVFCALVLWTTPGFGFDRFEILTTEELKGMVDARDAGKSKFTLINTLDEIIYRDVSIPGSVNLPWHLAQDAEKYLGPNKDQLLVFY